jgi:hypothetical protein
MDVAFSKRYNSMAFGLINVAGIERAFPKQEMP